MKRSIGIIGFGRFGQFLVDHLKDHFDVSVSDCVDRKNEARKLGVELTTLQECAKKDMIILSVPISELEGVLQRIVPELNPDSLILDVCSVKEYPIRIMEELLPSECEFVGTHPLFGPDTACNGLKGKKIVLCPQRTKRLGQIREFLETLGLQVIVAEADEHDLQMARSLALIHLLGWAFNGIGVQKIDMATKSHEMFLDLMNIANNDSRQLFLDMQLYNRFTKDARNALIRELVIIDGELNGREEKKISGQTE
jgi:prephenate dehydrogenase